MVHFDQMVATFFKNNLLKVKVIYEFILKCL